ncbi:MAG: response regulator [Hyphomicrobium sp.]|jgi:two-component system, probable response regulator PhcQ
MKKSGTILFVDDEPLSLKYFKASVGKYANVKTAGSAHDALEILEADGDEISVVVSDERMPHDSGVSFLSDVRKSWPSTVRILTSAYANIDNLQHAINDAGIYRFVPKPWNLDELSAAMQDALEVERSAAALAEPVIGPTSPSDAESANLALLAILAGGLEAPLKSLDAEAQRLTQLSAPGPLEKPQAATTYMTSWTNRLRTAKIAASASQVQRDVEQCRSLANSINNLARSLTTPAAIPATSMLDTLSDVIEQIASSPARPVVLPALNPSHDFTYRVPREIMKFLLTNVLRTLSASRTSEGATPTISLFSGAAHNEVRFGLAGYTPLALDDHQSWRTIRSALWAFDGELLTSTDENTGSSSLSMCLPKAE